MVKKGGQAKGGKPGGGGGAGAGGGNKKPASAKPAEDSDFIVFSNSDKDPKPKKPVNATSQGEASGSQPGDPPKPTVKQLIGGASWTGKTPVNMLSEHCQKQKWEKPEYSMVSFTSLPYIECADVRGTKDEDARRFLLDGHLEGEKSQNPRNGSASALQASPHS